MASPSTEWTCEEYKAFEIAVVVNATDIAEDKWDKIASQIPGNKTIEDIKQHYQIYLQALDAIDVEYISTPTYTTTNENGVTDAESGIPTLDISEYAIADMDYEIPISPYNSDYNNNNNQYDPIKVGYEIPILSYNNDNSNNQYGPLEVGYEIPISAYNNKSKNNDKKKKKKGKARVTTPSNRNYILALPAPNFETWKDKNEGKRRANNKKGVNKGKSWNETEHRTFLRGLKKYGKGKWHKIANNFFTTRTSTQVASHAQKYFARLSGKRKHHNRPSILDITSSDGQISDKFRASGSGSSSGSNDINNIYHNKANYHTLKLKDEFNANKNVIINEENNVDDVEQVQNQDPNEVQQVQVQDSNEVQQVPNPVAGPEYVSPPMSWYPPENDDLDLDIDIDECLSHLSPSLLDDFFN